MATTYEDLEGEDGEREPVPVEQLNALGQPGNPVRVPAEPTMDNGPGGMSQEGHALGLAQQTSETEFPVGAAPLVPESTNDPANAPGKMGDVKATASDITKGDSEADKPALSDDADRGTPKKDSDKSSK